MLERALGAPEDLRSAVLQSLLIPRYTRIYKEGVFRDSTGAHTIRCVEMAKELDLPKEEGNKIIRMLWIHDLPEIITSDFSIIEKGSNQNLSIKLDKEEAKAARNLLSKKDQELLTEFNMGLSPEAFTAKVIDRVDGNVFFHHNLSRWVISDEYRPEDIPNQKSLVYTFDVYKNIYKELSEQTKFGDSYRKIINRLLIKQLSDVVNIWENAPKRKIPEVLITQLSWAKNELSSLKTPPKIP